MSLSENQEKVGIFLTRSNSPGYQPHQQPQGLGQKGGGYEGRLEYKTQDINSNSSLGIYQPCDPGESQVFSEPVAPFL